MHNAEVPFQEVVRGAEEVARRWAPCQAAPVVGVSGPSRALLTQELIKCAGKSKRRISIPIGQVYLARRPSASSTTGSQRKGTGPPPDWHPRSRPSWSARRSDGWCSYHIQTHPVHRNRRPSVLAVIHWGGQGLPEAQFSGEPRVALGPA